MNNQIHVLSRAVIIDNDHILLCKTKQRDQEFFYLPGGHIEHSESAYQAIVREMQEEAGVECSVERFLGCLEYNFSVEKYSNCCHTHEYNLLFKVVSPSLATSIPLKRMEAHTELAWVSLKDLVIIDLRPEPLKILIPKWLESDYNEAFESEIK